MYGQALHVVSPILGMTINVFTQVVSFRIKPNLSLLRTIFLGFFSGLVTMIIFDVVTLSYNKNSLDYFLGDNFH